MGMKGIPEESSPERDVQLVLAGKRLLTKATRGRPWSDALECFSRLLQGFTEEEIAASIAQVHEKHMAPGADFRRI